MDTEIDKRLEKLGPKTELKGKAGVANARLAYEAYEEVFAGERWAALELAGAKPQRPLWASTGVKDPAYPDTMYVDDLVARGVVNTMPEATLDAEADHGKPVRATRSARTTTTPTRCSTDLAAAGVSYDDVVQLLEDEGVDKFEASWNELLEAVQSELDKLR